MRFLLVGATTVAIDFLVYQLLLLVGLPLDLAKALSFVVATVCAYLFNRSFTFRAGGGGHVVRRFVVLYTVALLVNVGVNALTLRMLAEDGTSDPALLAVVVAFLAAQVVSSTLNFVGMRHWVFAART
jgi:putative flippase GtrA